MNIITKVKGEKDIVFLEGRLDSTNALEVENYFEALDNKNSIIIDLEKLDYVSSAGLRVILKVRKTHPELELIGASSEVYDILQMTGFTDMIPVSRQYRKISIDGCEVIGQGANGKIYRIDPDTVVKMYINPDSLEDIQHEREVARKALILGIPTAISYDVVKIGDCYASMFEMINAKSFSKLLAANPEKIDEYAELYIDLLKTIHSTVVPEGDLPEMKDTALNWLEFLKDYLPQNTYQKLFNFISSIARSNNMVHGDYHTKNVMLQNGEVILIDMDTLAVGDPIFEFAAIYLAFVGYSILDHSGVENFLGIPFEVSEIMWKKTLELYYETFDEDFLREKEEKCLIVAYIRLMRRAIKKMSGTKEGETLFAYSKEKLILLAENLDSLYEQ